MKEKALELLKIFSENGYEAYLVGGFVRDYVLGKKSFDIDICTNVTPRQVQEIFKGAKLPFEGYGSVHLSYKNINFEITTYRMDLEYKDKRKPSKIVYTNSLLIDLKRRDFTMNTLCMDKDGNVIDKLDAIDDIKNGIIKTVGNAYKKISDDAFRILRAIRFATELDFKISDDLKDAILQNRESLNSLSFYRKKQELNKIFSSPNALLGINLLRNYGLDEYLDIDLSKDVVKTNDPIGIWAQINPSDHYPFTSNEKDYLKAILEVLKDERINDTELYKYGNYVCYIASQILKIEKINIYERYDMLPIKKISDININGKEIIDILSLRDKSKVKIIQNDIVKKIINKEINNDKEELKKYIIDTYSNNML